MRNNIITAIAGDKPYIKTDSVFQYDYGLKLVISGVTLPQEYDVHFSNTNKPSAKTVTGDSSGVLVPDEYLLNGEDVHAWVYLHTEGLDDDGETVYHIQIPVVARAAIAEEQITPIEHNVIKEALEEIAEAVEETQANVTHYPYINENGYWMVYDALNEQFVNTGIDANGNDGYSPTISVVDITGGHRVTITDENGPHVFDVMDGDPSVIIDDNAGSSVENRTWSAKKLSEEFSGKYTKPASGIPASDMAAGVIPDISGKADKANPEFTGNGSFTGYVTVGPDSEKLGVIRDGFLFNEERFLKPLEATETLAGTTWFFTVDGYFTATAVSCTFTSDSPYPGSQFPGASGPFTHTLSISTNRITDTITSAGQPSQTVYMYGSQYHPGTWDDQNHRVYTIPNEPTSYSPDKETFMETFLSKTIRVSEYEIIDNALYCDIASGIEYLWDGTQFVDVLKNGFDLKANKNNPEFSGHASFGYNSEATGNDAFASGDSAIASGNYSNSLGRGTKAAGSSSHVVGRYNIEDVFPLWVADTHYYVNDIVKVERRFPIGGGVYYVYRICTIENQDSSFDESKWAEYPESSRYIEIVGNGENNNSRSNARTLDWNGNEELAGDLTINKGKANEVSVTALNTKIMQTGAYYIDRNLFENPTTVNSNASNVINAAIIDAQAKGLQYCVIPEGEYWITQTIYLKSDVILCGCGMDATTLKIADNCDIDAIRVAAPTNNSGIMDLSIDGNRIQNYSTFANGHHGNAINVWLHYGRIERVRTNWVYKHSLLLNYDTGSSDDGLGFEPEHQNDMGNLNKVLWCDFRDSLLQGVMWGWRTMDSWMCYTNVGSHAANLYLEGGTSRFIGNHFDGDGNNGAGPEYNVYCGDGCNAMVFEGNIFENTQKENIFFRQPSYSNQTMTITIANNIIRTCSKSQNEQYANIKISGYSSSVPATEIVISGNQILNPDTNGNNGYAGIHLAYCENCKIFGNTFFNVGNDDVVIDNTCSNINNDGLVSPVIVSGTTPVITGQAGLRYICGECSTLSIAVPSSGMIDVVFESGSTATVLTITPPTGVTVRWPEWFDPTDLQANATYEINIADGMGVVAVWA